MRQTIGAMTLAAFLLLAGPLTPLGATSEETPGLDAGEVGEIITELSTEVSGIEGQWTALYRGTRVVVHANDRHGRMRIMAPVASAADQSVAELRVMLEANYARALDAKFAIGDGVVWSLFNRSLRTLDRESLRDGLEQVVTLKRNFGSSYRSTDLTFGSPPPSEN